VTSTGRSLARVGLATLARVGLATLALAVASCAFGGSPRLQGHWRGVRAEGVAGETANIANAFAEGMELEIRGESISVTTGGQLQTGRYRVIREDANAVVMATDTDGPADPQTFTFQNADTLRWAVLPGKAIVFTRD
jgi:hypothetical protein